MRLFGAHRILGGAALAATAGLSVPAAGGSLTYSGSVQAATGTYLYSERTNSLYVYNGIAVAGTRWRVSGTVPLIAQSSPLLYAGGSAIPRSGGGSAGGGGGGGSGDEDEHDRHHRAPGKTSPARPAAAAMSAAHPGEIGLGDPLVRADFEVLRPAQRLPSARVGAQVKMPLGSRGDHGFGTGEWDYGAGLSLAKPVGRGSVFADATYWVLGDLPDLDLESTVAYGISYGRPLPAPKFALLASFIGYSRLVAGVDPPAQAGLLLSYWLRPERSLSAGMAFGVTDSAPDVSLSLGWRVGL